MIAVTTGFLVTITECNPLRLKCGCVSDAVANQQYCDGIFITCSGSAEPWQSLKFSSVSKMAPFGVILRCGTTVMGLQISGPIQ